MTVLKIRASFLLEMGEFLEDLRCRGGALARSAFQKPHLKGKEQIEILQRAFPNLENKAKTLPKHCGLKLLCSTQCLQNAAVCDTLEDYSDTWLKSSISIFPPLTLEYKPIYKSVHSSASHKPVVSECAR